MKENPAKTKIRLVIYHDSSLVYQKSKMIPGSIRTFWYKDSAESKGNDKFGKRSTSHKDSSLKLEV